MSAEFDHRLWQALFDTAIDAVFVSDQDTMQILDANQAACDMFGFTRDELLGMSIAQMSEDPEVVRRNFLEGVNVIPVHYQLRKDGTAVPVEIHANQFEIGGRRIRVGFLRDISERLESQRALEASERKFATAFQTSPDSVNINRVSDGMYVDVNEGFCKLTGYGPEDVAGRTSLDIRIWNNPADRDRLVEGIRRDGAVENLEAEFRRKDGTVTTALMSARPIEVNGEHCVLSVTRDITDRKRSEMVLVAANTQLEKMVRDVVAAIGRVVESRDPYTNGHQSRVAQVARLLAEEMGLDDADVYSIELAALLHDVGKLAVPSEILNKPVSLTALEFELITVHPEWGYEILKDIEFPAPVARIVLQHHERMDGSGYPKGLHGSEILPEARILAVADVVEAMASFRPYRPALGVETAVEEIRNGSGRYDADAMQACLRLYERGALEFLRG